MKCPRCNGTGQLPDTIGTLIRNEREAIGVSQTELAKVAGISRNGLAIIERGGNAQLETLQAIAKALGLELHIKLGSTTITQEEKDGDLS
jgi:transcriptional regulator with XRE-family HTH domain